MVHFGLKDVPFGPLWSAAGNIHTSGMRLELTRRGSYAIRAVVCLARQENDELIPSARIASQMGIPRRFLPQVMGDLVRVGILEARVGRTGGYRLAQPADRLNLLQVIEAAEGDARRRVCVLRGVQCSRIGGCDVHEVFETAQEALLAELARTSVATAANPERGPTLLATAVPPVAPAAPRAAAGKRAAAAG